uniref:AP2/ERF domain-containing protein n=1 Tax=Prymnesium polylepis TaxID=72548 RepID=A0A7S4J573_9EUKA|mmetsp:Transcript_39454/g.98373  ORF Transcript_39454/g.98373 Transcript_39454/m.98373 type:complete len:184 (+) Transcript_39454:80-631(+)
MPKLVPKGEERGQLAYSKAPSGFKYVTEAEKKGAEPSYYLRVTIDGQQTHLGTFSSAVAAANAYVAWRDDDVDPVGDVEPVDQSQSRKRPRKNNKDSQEYPLQFRSHRAAVEYVKRTAFLPLSDHKGLAKIYSETREISDAGVQTHPVTPTGVAWTWQPTLEAAATPHMFPTLATPGAAAPAQ